MYPAKPQRAADWQSAVRGTDYQYFSVADQDYYGIYDETMDTAMAGITMDEYEEIIRQLYILGKKRKLKESTLPQRR